MLGGQGSYARRRFDGPAHRWPLHSELCYSGIRLIAAQGNMPMIDLYYWTTPNGHKITIFLEETGLPYNIMPVNIGKGEQFKAEFLAVSPNNRIPALIDRAPAGGRARLREGEGGQPEHGRHPHRGGARDPVRADGGVGRPCGRAGEIGAHRSLATSCAGLTRASIFFAKGFTKMDGLPGHKRVHARLPTRYARQ